MDRWKSRGGEELERKRKEGKSEKRKRKKKDAAVPKGRKVAKHSFFSLTICGSGGSKKGSLKWRVQSHVVK